MVVTIGPAGTGKTYIPAAMAAYFYHIGKVDKIVLTRPTVPVDTSIGYFPGDLLEKMQPWTAPFISVLEEFLSKGEVDCMVKNGKLDIVPFEVIRGRTFNKSFVILDEAQNTTVGEMKAFLTRTGQESRTVINGDLRQSDLKGHKQNGLDFALNILSDANHGELCDSVGIVEFDSKDIVRSGLCRLWVEAFERLE